MGSASESSLRSRTDLIMMSARRDGMKRRTRKTKQKIESTTKEKIEKTIRKMSTPERPFLKEHRSSDPTEHFVVSTQIHSVAVVGRTERQCVRFEVDVLHHDEQPIGLHVSPEHGAHDQVWPLLAGHCSCVARVGSTQMKRTNSKEMRTSTLWHI